MYGYMKDHGAGRERELGAQGREGERVRGSRQGGRGS